MTKEEIAERVKQLMTVHKLEQKDLARLLHMTQGGISHNLSGRNSFSIKKLIRLANYFNVDISYFTKENNTEIEKQLSHKKTILIQRVPVLKWEHLIKIKNIRKELNKIAKEGAMGLDFLELPKSKLYNDDCIAIKAPFSDAMISPYPNSLSLYPNDIVLIDTSRIPVHTNLVLAKSNDDWFIRQYQQDGTKEILKSFSPQYPIILVSDVEIEGVIIEIRKNAI